MRSHLIPKPTTGTVGMCLKDRIVSVVLGMRGYSQFLQLLYLPRTRDVALKEVEA